jgi:hypothetical protein
LIIEDEVPGPALHRAPPSSNRRPPVTLAGAKRRARHDYTTGGILLSRG